MRSPYHLTFNRVFSLVVFAALTAQLFYPLVFAQSDGSLPLGPPVTNPDTVATAFPSPSPASGAAGASPSPTPLPPSTATPVPPPASIGVCTISEFSADEWQRFKAAAFNFEGKELTDKNDAKLREQKAGQNVIVNNYNFPAEDSVVYVSVEEVARLMGRKAQDVADELGVDVKESITLSQAAIVASKDPKGGDFMAKLRAAVARKKPEVQAPGFESLKVRLPSGRDVELSELYKLQQIRAGEGQPKACLLDSSVLRGRIEYAALLDQDLLIGADKSSQTLEHLACEGRECQHLTTDSIRASITSYDGNLVIQSFYEKAVREIGAWFFWDFFSSALIGISSASDFGFAKRNHQSSSEYFKLLNERSIERGLSEQTLRRGIASDEAKEVLSEWTSKMASSRVGKEQVMEMRPAVKGRFEALLTKVDGDPTDATSNLGKALSGVRTEAKSLQNVVDDIDKDLLKGTVTETVTETVTNPATGVVTRVPTERVRPLTRDEVAVLVRRRDDFAGRIAAKEKDVSELNTLNQIYSEELSSVIDPSLPLEGRVAAARGHMEEKFKKLPTREEQIKFLEKYGVIDPEESQIVKYRGNVDGVEARLNQLNSELFQTERIATFGYRRAWSNALLGATWLGPGRIGLELAGQIVMASATEPDKERGDSLLVYINNGDFLRVFRKSTDFFGLGRIVEALSEFLPISVPYKAFVTSPMVAIQATKAGEREKNSYTSLLQAGEGWQLQPRWEGESDLTLFEDVRDGKSWSSVAFKTNYLRFSAGLNRKKELRGFYSLALQLAPIVTWRTLRVPDFPQALVTLVQLQLLELYIDNIIDPLTFSEKEKCSDEKLNHYLLMYKALVGATLAEQALLFTPVGAAQLRHLGFFLDQRGFAGSSTLLSKVSDRYRRVQIVDPLEWAKGTYGHLAIEYSLSCKDPSYKVVAYQKIPEKSTRSDVVARIKQKTSDPLGVDKILQNLNLGRAFAGVGQQIKKSELKDLMSIKSLQINQGGLLKPAELYGVRLDPDGSDLQWWRVFEKQCFRNCLQQADGKFVCADATGGYVGPDREYLFDREHALMSDFVPALGLVVPNKLISAPLNCRPESVVLKADASGDLSVVDGSCPAMDCSIKSLIRISGQNVDEKISKIIGTVQAIYTTNGVASLAGREYRFMRTKGAVEKKFAAGVKVSEKESAESEAKPSDTTKAIPGLRDIENRFVPLGGLKTGRQTTSLVGMEKRFTGLQVTGDGRVRAAGVPAEEGEVGELLTIQTQNGVIHFDRATRKLHIALKTLAEAHARDIAGISTSPARIAGPKADLQKLASELASMRAALVSGQSLSKEQVELLRKILEKPTPTGETLSQQERELYEKALEKKSQGIKLSEAEQKVVDKAQLQERFPGVIVLPPNTIERIETAVKQQPEAVSSEKAKEIAEKLREGQPLSRDEKNAVQQAIQQQADAGKLGKDEASRLKADVEKTVAPPQRAVEIAEKLASGQQLSQEQKDLAQKAVEREAKSASERAARADDTPLPAIKLGGVTPKVGGEESARALNTALEKVGAFDQIKSENKVISFDRNEKGEPVVRVADRQTREVQELKITGAPTKEGDAVSVPTDKGPVRVEVNVNRDTGAPVVNINGPQGLRDSSPLIFAQGPGGLLFFDPKTGTWQVRNGGVIPGDDAFAKNGISFFGSPDGTRAISEQSRFGYSRQLENAPTYNPLLSLPSWPENNLLAAAMLALILVGVVFVRLRAWKKEF